MAEAAPRRATYADIEAVPAHLVAEMGVALLCPLDDLFPFASPEA
ncbi:hypothetical protein [Methylobacterium sp. Leaf456]|nr:hypothetical protein [Methylobacterium sp. Leaf456]